jgi:hypothetical protein
VIVARLIQQAALCAIKGNKAGARMYLQWAKACLPRIPF